MLKLGQSVFQAPHVSPETSNLAKRIARYSSGSFGIADPFLDGKEDQPAASNRVEYPRPGMDNSAMEVVETDGIPKEGLQASLMMDDLDNDDEQEHSTDMQSDGLTDEDSFSEVNVSPKNWKVQHAR